MRERCVTAFAPLVEAIPQTRAAAEKNHVQPVRRTVGWSGAHSSIKAYLAFMLVASLYLLPFMRVVLPHSNEGTLIYGAVRIVQGEVFARDFFEVMGPGTFYIVALFFKLFGVTFIATRIWLFASSFESPCASTSLVEECAVVTRSSHLL